MLYGGTLFTEIILLFPVKALIVNLPRLYNYGKTQILRMS